ncbi:MAG: ABC-three component system middle component 6 [Clostridiaceae bacterium]
MIDCFSINKYQSVDENIPYIAMNLYKLMERPISIDKLFEKYSKMNQIDLSLNFERLLFLALTFLFSVGLLDLSDNLVRRVK